MDHARRFRFLMPLAKVIRSKPLINEVENAVEFTKSKVYESSLRAVCLNGLNILAATLKNPTRYIKSASNLGICSLIFILILLQTI
jgi:hypothetical protein